MVEKLEPSQYLRILFQSLNVPTLKALCKELNIKGFSKFKKAELVDFVVGSMSDEEITRTLEAKELEIINNEIDAAIAILQKRGTEFISEIRIKNSNGHVIEIDLKGFKWETTCFLELAGDLENPERDCDCKVGSENGLCPHFWLGVIVALKKGLINARDWIFTKLPGDLASRMQELSIPNLP